MSVFALYRCDECFAEATGDRLARRFVSMSGRGYGFGHYEFDDARTAAPDGWMAYDPYTGCTYCPACAESLREPETPKFPETFCSQCGAEFGPGDHGYSHCENHRDKERVRI